MRGLQPKDAELMQKPCAELLTDFHPAARKTKKGVAKTQVANGLMDLSSAVLLCLCRKARRENTGQLKVNRKIGERYVPVKFHLQMQAMM